MAVDLAEMAWVTSALVLLGIVCAVLWRRWLLFSQAPAVASEYAPWSQAAMTSLFFDYVLQGRMRVTDLITQRYSPLDAPRVYERLMTDRSSVMGLVFDWSQLGGQP